MNIALTSRYLDSELYCVFLLEFLSGIEQADGAMSSAEPAIDTLFLLSTGFADGSYTAGYYCPQCMIFEGVLSHHAELLAGVKVRRVDYPRPRLEITAFLDEEFQSCPLLILGSLPEVPWNGFSVQSNRSVYFLNQPEDIGNYLAQRYGIPRPH